MSVILFTSDVPDYYLRHQIYDPNTNPSGQIIPRPDSIVLDTAAGGLLLRVFSVDEDTFEVTYGPVQTTLLIPDIPSAPDDDESIVSVIDYGNCRFALYYDESETPTKLTVDKKVIIFGDDAKDYEIIKYNDSEAGYVSISMYFDTSGIYMGHRIPLAEIHSSTNVKVPTNCHTSMSLNDEDIYYLIIYDYAGTQCGSVKLFTKRALMNNAPDDDRIIVDFLIDSTQQDILGFYLVPNQDPLSLLINPRLVFNDGTIENVAIDDLRCHLYGLEGFTAAFPGQMTTILVKYFLSDSQQTTDGSLTATGGIRHIHRSVDIRVIDPGTNDYNVKILTVPRYVSSMSKYVLTFFMYSLETNDVVDITNHVTVTPALDGYNTNSDQAMSLTFNIQDVFPLAVSNLEYQQPVVVRLAPHSYYERYLLRDSIGDSVVYGTESPALARPVLYYDDTIEQYFIPTSKFPNKNTVLQAFYYNARPLFDDQLMTSPMEPTHFTLRDAITGDLLLASPVAIDGFTSSFTITGTTNPSRLVGSSCIVEFLKDESGTYDVLYGAPVDVYTGTHQ